MKFYMALIMAMLGVGLVVGAAAAQGEINYTEMMEDLQVMCRIIDETMDETFENDYVKGGFFRRAGCQHLYLKGYGAVFLLDVQFPVAEKEIKVAIKEEKTDLWEKYEREVRYRHRPDGGMWVIGNDESYSKEKVDKLKEQLAYLVGEYGSRIGQLALADTISFVVFGRSDYAVDLETDIMGFARHVVEVEHVGADAPVQTVKVQVGADAIPHTPETIEEEKEKFKELNEKHQTLIETAEQILEAKRKREKDKRLRMHILPVPPIPPIPPSLPHGFHGKPATTLILTFKRSQLEGKKGTDWEALLKAAEVVEY